MIASKDANFVGVLNFEGKEEANGFNALPSAINIVPHKQVGGFGWKASVLEEPKHVIVLSVDVATDLDGGINLNKHGLFHENVLDGPDEPEYIAFWKFDQFSRFGSAYLQQSLDYLIDVEFNLVLHHQ